MRKRIITALVIMAALVLLVGCGPRRTATSDMTAEQPATQEQKAPEAAAPTPAPAPAPTEAAAPAPTFGGAEAAKPAGGEQVTSQDVKPETIGAAAPAEPAAAVPAAKVSLPEFTDIHFDFDKYDIKSDDHNTLNMLADTLIKTEAVAMIEGHCDERGTNEYNLALGDRRAKSTRDYLMARGVPSRKLKTSSFGEERPLCTQSDESCWSKNRRSHFVINTK